MEKQFLTCECGSNEHHLVVIHDPIDNEIILTVNLSTLPVFKRIILGIRYIFGYKSKYGAYDEIILDKASVSKLQDILYKYRYNTK